MAAPDPANFDEDLSILARLPADPTALKGFNSGAPPVVAVKPTLPRLRNICPDPCVMLALWIEIAAACLPCVPVEIVLMESLPVPALVPAMTVVPLDLPSHADIIMVVTRTNTIRTVDFIKPLIETSSWIY
jgi:hypothetical protein